MENVVEWKEERKEGDEESSFRRRCVMQIPQTLQRLGSERCTVELLSLSQFQETYSRLSGLQPRYSRNGRYRNADLWRNAYFSQNHKSENLDNLSSHISYPLPMYEFRQSL